jgi:hypothetical protein
VSNEPQQKKTSSSISALQEVYCIFLPAEENAKWGDCMYIKRGEKVMSIIIPQRLT